MTEEAAFRRERWLDTQPDWVREVYHTHGAIHQLIDDKIEHGRGSEFLWREVARMLLTQTQRDAKALADLRLIAPARVKGPDGKEWVYRCPDELVPLSGA